MNAHVHEWTGWVAYAIGCMLEAILAGDFVGAGMDHANALEHARTACQ